MANLIRTTFLLTLIVTGACVSDPPAPESRPEGVRFLFHAPSARSVAVAGSFNRWEPESMSPAGPDQPGVWMIAIPLPAGRYSYLFVVNGSDWLLDPAAPSEDDGLGGRDSVVFVPPVNAP